MRLYHAPRVRPPRDRPLPRPRLDGTRQQRRVPHLPRGGPDRLPLRPRSDDRLADRRTRRDRLPLAGPPRRRRRGRRPLHAARDEELRPRVRAPRRRPGRGAGPQRPGLLRLRAARSGRAPGGLATGAHRVTAFERQTLSNGVRVLTAPMPQAQSVTCALMFAAGSRYETRATNGIAHFAEHMFFKGTERRPSARQIAGEIDSIGGEFNAFTGKELTAYYVKCAAEHRDVALDVLVDMLRHSRFASEEIEREKGVIVEEMNMYYDTPRDYIGGVYDGLLYGDQPLGWDIIGRKETVRAAQRETFLHYLGRWYKPSRMVVGVAGKTGDGLVDRVEKLLGDLEEAPTGEPAPVEISPNGAPQVKVHTKQSDQAHLIL